MTITDSPVRRVAFFWSDSDKEWCTLEVAIRKRVDDEWFCKTIRMTIHETEHLAKLIGEGRPWQTS